MAVYSERTQDLGASSARWISIPRSEKLSKKPVSDYYNFKYLKGVLDELGMLRSGDPRMDFKEEMAKGNGKGPK